MHTPYNSNLDSLADRNQRILIIDDNVSIHEDVRKILGAPSAADESLDSEAAELFGISPEPVTSASFEIDSAFQGQEGLEMVQRALDEGRPYAMAFIDVRMPPGWDGIETISRIWNEYPDLQVVICTAYSDYSWEEMIRKVGKTDNLVILKKPFDNVEVLQLAHTLTRKWTLSNRLQVHLEGLDKIVAARTEELQTANIRLRREMEERVQAERELNQSEERFAKAFQASPIAMTIQSRITDRFVDVNEAFLKLTGYERTEIIGRTPVELDLCPDPDVPLLLRVQINEERSVRNFECQLRTSEGKIRDCVVFAEAFELGDEAVALVATQDVSEQRRLEKQLRHSQKLEAVGQFAAGVAHDFNNMLTVIQGHASIHLTADKLEKDVANSLSQVSLAAERAAALTRQLLTFSRKQIVQPQVLDLNAIVNNVQGMLRRLIGEHIDLQCECDPNLASIYADESNIEQVVVNLVVNARDAMPQGGCILIRTEQLVLDKSEIGRHPKARPGTFACLSITDTGCGMSAETMSHIFEPFFTTKEVGKGTGLGLATVYGIVSQLDGWIEVSSKLEQGTNFKILLPICDADPVQTLMEEFEDLRGNGESILVVEDESAVREVITHVLRTHGYHVFEAGDGPEALALWESIRDQVRVLVTDIVMPNGLKGNVLAERLKADRPELKIIFSSGYSAEFATEASPLDEKFSFLGKPYKPEVLLREVRECLAQLRVT